MLRGCLNLGPHGDQPKRWFPRPPNGFDNGAAHLTRLPTSRRVLVESDQDVTNVDISDRAPRHVGVENRRARPKAIGASVLTATVHVDARVEPDIRTVVARDDVARRVAEVFGLRARGLVTGFRVFLNK